MNARSFARHVERRMVQPDWTQLLTLFFGVLLFVIATRWTGLNATMNDSWFGLAPTRWVCLALLAVGYGAAFSERPRTHRGAAIVHLMLAAALSYPLELATHAASHPDVPLWWGLVVPLLAVVAYFGLGHLLGRLSRWSRLRSLLPITVPGLLIGLTWLDIRLGASIVNPLTTATNVAPAHLILVAAGAVATVVVLVMSQRSALEDGPS